MGRDPVMGMVGGGAIRWNPYIYAGANPVNYTDPSGRFFGLLGAMGAGAVIGGVFGTGMEFAMQMHELMTQGCGMDFNTALGHLNMDSIGQAALQGVGEGIFAGAVGYVGGVIGGAATGSQLLGAAIGEAIDFAGGMIWDMNMNGLSVEEAAIANIAGAGIGAIAGRIGASAGVAWRNSIGDVVGDAVRGVSGVGKFASNKLKGFASAAVNVAKRGMNYASNMAQRGSAMAMDTLRSAAHYARAIIQDVASRFRNSGGSCSLNSFSADTPVSTTEGDKAISDVEVGDTVYAYDPETGEVGEHVVTDTIVHEDDAITYVTIDAEEIETTPWHLFYTDDGWVKAEDLVSGDLVLSLDGDYGTVESVIIIDESQLMYDLTVDEVHTFAVGDGEWVVHNSNKRLCVFDPEVEEWLAVRSILPFGADRAGRKKFSQLNHELGGGLETNSTARELPKMLESDLTDDHIVNLEANLKGHIENTWGIQIDKIIKADPNNPPIWVGVLGQISLARYRFLGGRDPRLQRAIEIERLALEHPLIPSEIKAQALERLAKTISLLE